MNARVLLAAFVLVSAPYAEAATLSPVNFSGSVAARSCTSGCSLFDPTSGVNASDASPNSSARNSLDLSKAPSILADAFAALPAGTLGDSDFRSLAGSEVTLSYGFQVVGPSPASVPVRIVAKASVEVSGGLYTDFSSSNAFARLFIGSTGIGTSPAINTELRVTYPLGKNVGKISSAESYDGLFSFASGVANFVLMQASATAIVATATPPLVSIGAVRSTAFVDPFFEITPEFAALGYSLVFTEGIRNSLEDPPSSVPLPASGLLMSGALLGLARFSRRRIAGYMT